MKAILVIDMPTECNDEKCPICYDNAMCSYLNRWIKDGKPNDCPLIPLPQKLDANDWHRMFSGTFSEREAKGYGWNACRYAIVGETE